MAVIVLLGCTGLARAITTTHTPITLADTATVQFPLRLGNYTLVRSWNETQFAGPVVYAWAQYAPADGGTPIALGISPLLGWHNPLLCHYIRGEAPLWRGQLTTATAGGVPAALARLSTTTA